MSGFQTISFVCPPSLSSKHPIEHNSKNDWKYLKNKKKRLFTKQSVWLWIERVVKINNRFLWNICQGGYNINNLLIKMAFILSLKTTTWYKDSHSLYDYESSLNKQTAENFTIGLPEDHIGIFRRKNQSESNKIVYITQDIDSVNRE